MSNSLTKDSLKFVAILVLVIGIIVGVFLVRRSNDTRNRAATSTGTGKFLFNAPAGSTSIAPGSQSSLTITASGTGQSQIDGFQVIATFTGSVPADMTLTPATIPGLSAISPSITDVSGGKKLVMAFITVNPQAPFNANGGVVTLGTITFTAPTTGTMTVTVDQTTSKIGQSVTGTDLLGLQNAQTFTFSSPATTTPVATVTMTPQPTATATVPTSTATPRPSVNPVPTATPIGSTSVSILAKFAGITRDVGPIVAKVTNGSTTATSVTFTYTANGIYKARLVLPSGTALPTSLTFAVKPEKHVQKIFRNWPVAAGVADVSTKAFEPGDLPPQDGTVNSTDISAVIGTIGKPSQTAADLKIADVNYDGVVNAVDIGLILSTLSTKPDESL